MADKLKGIRENGLQGKNPGDESGDSSGDNNGDTPGDNGGGGSSTEEPAPVVDKATMVANKSGEVGKLVKYTPKGESYEVLGTGSDKSNGQIFTADTNIKWKIWDIDNDYLYLISDRPTEKTITVYGYTGCTNLTNILSELCAKNYKSYEIYGSERLCSR